MKGIGNRRPSASMVVALVALVVAASGTAVAATSLVKGNSLIRKNSLWGNRLIKHSVTPNRLKNNSLTGRQINLSKLGTVPNAKSALSALTATNVSGSTRFVKTIAAGGGTPSTGNTVTLGTAGPLEIYGVCFVNTLSETEARLYLSSTVAGYYVLTGGTAYQFTAGANLWLGLSDSSAPGTTDFPDPYKGTVAAITATADHYITSLVSLAVNLTSANGCTFAGFTAGV